MALGLARSCYSSKGDAASRDSAGYVGHRLYGAHVAFHVDNMAVVAVLQHRAPNNLQLTHLLCCLSFYAALYHFEFCSSHTLSSQNTAADALAHDNLTLFSASFPRLPDVLCPSQSGNHYCITCQIGPHRNGSVHSSNCFTQDFPALLYSVVIPVCPQAIPCLLCRLQHDPV